MNKFNINRCPGDLSQNNNTYSRKVLSKMFNGRKVSHLLPFNSPSDFEITESPYTNNVKQISISGVQEKFSLILEKNKLVFPDKNQAGQYILKPIPKFGKNLDQMPANEHLTMQIASQVFNINSAHNVLIFFNNNEIAYLTKRFDINPNGDKKAMEDFASIAGLTHYNKGVNYKYSGNYLDLFKLLKKYIPAYSVEAPKLFKRILFNYVFSNGDAHYKNFSVIETGFGDFKLSPCYDLLNTKLHIKDSDFALEEGLLPKSIAKGSIKTQFELLAKMSKIKSTISEKIILELISNRNKVEELINSSFLTPKLQRSYLQHYQHRLKKLEK
jgi:serine/threonine-protein kinase HipA